MRNIREEFELQQGEMPYSSSIEPLIREKITINSHSPRRIRPWIEVHKFDGNDPLTWVSQVEQLLELHHVSRKQWVPIAS
jgi:hypothetical protein